MRSLARAAVALAAVASLSGCAGGTGAGPSPVEGGEPSRGAAVIRAYGCGACHTIPGIAGADGRVGPDLGEIGARIGDEVPPRTASEPETTPENLVRWLRDPKAVDRATFMPALGLTEAQARDAAAFLLAKN